MQPCSLRLQSSSTPTESNRQHTDPTVLDLWTLTACMAVSILHRSASVRPSVGRSVSLSVCPQSVLRQNGWLDPDAVTWVVSGIGRGMGISDGGPRVSRKRAVSVIFRHLRPHSFEWAEWCIVRPEMYSTRVWKVDNISVRTRYCEKRRFIGFLM